MLSQARPHNTHAADENEASSNVLVPSVVFGATAVVILAVILAVIGLVIARHTICINHRASPLSEQQHEVTTSTLLKEKDLATADVNGRHHSYSYASDVSIVCFDRYSQFPSSSNS